MQSLLDNSGISVGTLTYSAFGSTTVNVGATDRYQYTGREWDAALGLQFNRDRMYLSSSGRWLSEDPSSFSAGDPNLMRYVGNGPTNGRDPSGNWLFLEQGSDYKTLAVLKFAEVQFGSFRLWGYSAGIGGYRTVVFIRPDQAKAFKKALIDAGHTEADADLMTKGAVQGEDGPDNVLFSDANGVDRFNVYEELNQRQRNKIIATTKFAPTPVLTQRDQQLITQYESGYGLTPTRPEDREYTLKTARMIVIADAEWKSTHGGPQFDPTPLAMMDMAIYRQAGAKHIKNCVVTGVLVVVLPNPVAAATRLLQALKFVGNGVGRFPRIVFAAPKPVINVVPNTGKLVFDPATKSWTSPGGLVYGQGSKHGNRVKHVFEHLVPDPLKKSHSVFQADKTKLIGTIDEGFAKKALPIPNDPGAYIIDMGRVIGMNGETRMKIIFRPGTNQIIAAYPIH